MLVSHRYADELLEAYQTKRPIAPISEREPSLTLMTPMPSNSPRWRPGQPMAL